MPERLAKSMRFFFSPVAPCPYLPGRRERKAFTSLGVQSPDALHSTLSELGFRRSRSIAYRPACLGCNACQSVRVDVRNFKFDKKWRRVLNKNSDLVSDAAEAKPTREQYRLLDRYLDGRHPGGGMSGMSFKEYAQMIGASPVRSAIFEYRQGPDDDAPLASCAFTDVLRDGLSMVYTFFTPDEAGRSLGSYMVLDHIMKAKQLGLPHVYLGFWVEGSGKMDYKRRFKPLQVLENDRWRPLEDPA